MWISLLINSPSKWKFCRISQRLQSSKTWKWQISLQKLQNSSEIAKIRSDSSKTDWIFPLCRSTFPLTFIKLRIPINEERFHSSISKWTTWNAKIYASIVKLNSTNEGLPMKRDESFPMVIRRAIVECGCNKDGCLILLTFNNELCISGFGKLKESNRSFRRYENRQTKTQSNRSILPIRYYCLIKRCMITNNTSSSIRIRMQLLDE